jgi:hypothetical protein
VSSINSTVVGVAAGAAAPPASGIGVLVGIGKKIADVAGVGVGAAGAVAVVHAELEAVAAAAAAVLSDGIIRSTCWATPAWNGMDPTGLSSVPTL